MSLSKLSQYSPYEGYDVGHILTLITLPEQISASPKLRQLQGQDTILRLGYRDFRWLQIGDPTKYCLLHAL